MIAQARFKSVLWKLLAILALARTAVLAQQDNASQAQTQQDQNQPEATEAKPEATEAKPEATEAKPEATQAKPEAAQKQTEEAQAQKEDNGKLISVQGGKELGMSILGNQEAPKALVIVPWKRSELGSALGISTMLDDSRLPIDKEVFMRMLSYYEIRSETARPAGVPAKTNAAQPATAAPRRKP